MKNSASLLVKTCLLSATLAFTVTAHSAAFMKLGDIKGESRATAEQPASEQKIQTTRGGQAMLLPAVQSAREAARRGKNTPKPSSDHSAGDEHEITYDIAAGV
ncbi:hypothetical protein [Oceanicoccus sp. KOV_DT_Chl]|uniref:hypothetical protein n=1 Tax=Oceanicoccus sp. KOV_DT_Chl TaxID=1904639 RepID=UPI000C7AA1D8|nr:hypothetical protein [Oceanicoccus sp. KOV_DT_Chl]